MKTYTFHISLPGHGRVWRKLELAGENTLEDLHLAIQDAYEFDNDHLYSFFMSGKAWDQKTEYSLPEGVDPWGGIDDEPAAEEAEPAEALPAPTVQDVRMLYETLQTNPSARSQYVEVMRQQTGMSADAVESVLQNMNELLTTASDEELDKMLNLFQSLEEETNDVRTTTIESLNLRKGKKFLYLFDYGDEWRFIVRLESINPKADATAEYPRLVESVGEAPPQYPEWDEGGETRKKPNDPF